MVDSTINPLHPNISIHILQTVVYTFSKVLMRRICLTSRASLVADHFIYSCYFYVWYRGDIVRRNWLLVTLKERVKLHKIPAGDLTSSRLTIGDIQIKIVVRGSKCLHVQQKTNNGKSCKIIYRHEKKIATKDIITPFISHTTPFAWAMFPNHYNHYNITSPTECPK